MQEEWYELRIIVSDSFIDLIRKRATGEACKVLYRFKREVLLPIIEKRSIKNFLILDEFSDKDRFVLLRVNADEETSKQIKRDIEKTVQQSEFKQFFTHVELEVWSPLKDAKSRILSARKRAEQLGISFKGIPKGGWKVTGIKGYKLSPIGPILGPAIGLAGITAFPEWDVAPEDLEHKAELFARFMTNVVGQFTKAFLHEISEYIDDCWLLSVFIHLLLNSLSMWHEREARLFPCL